MSHISGAEPAQPHNLESINTAITCVDITCPSDDVYLGQYRHLTHFVLLEYLGHLASPDLYQLCAVSKEITPQDILLRCGLSKCFKCLKYSNCAKCAKYRY